MNKLKSKRNRRRKEILDVANYLIQKLKHHGVIIQRYDSKSSNSVYLKLDYGVLNSIRISDHKGKDRLKYKYNALSICPSPVSMKDKTDYGEVIRYYFPLKEKKLLLNQILKDRNMKIDMYGVHNYEIYKELKVAENYAKTGFWQQGRIV